MNAGERWHEAKLKCDAEQFRWIGKVVGLDTDQAGAFYALMPFSTIYTDDRWWLAATSAPPPTQHPDQISAYEPADAEVMLFDPVKNEVQILGDVAPQLFRPDRYAEASIVIYTNARTFLNRWARARLSHCLRAAQMSEHERRSLHEPRDGFMPGALVVGNISRIRWRGMPRRVVAPDPTTAHTIQRLIDRDTRAPRVSTTPEGDDAA